MMVLLLLIYENEDLLRQFLTEQAEPEGLGGDCIRRMPCLGDQADFHRTVFTGHGVRVLEILYLLIFREFSTCGILTNKKMSRTCLLTSAYMSFKFLNGRAFIFFFQKGFYFLRNHILGLFAGPA